MPNNFTPGPWVHEGQGDITGIENDPKNGCVGKVDIAAVYLRTVPGRSDANAALIASAPDLLAERDRLKALNAELSRALKILLKEEAPVYHDCTDNGEPECAWCMARAALAKQKESS